MPKQRNTQILDIAPDWHPSQRMLIFERVRFCADREAGCIVDEAEDVSDVFLWRAERGVVRLTRGNATRRPAFSPDGTSWVAEFPNGKLCVRRLGSRGRDWCGAAGGSYPSWQPVTGATRYF